MGCQQQAGAEAHVPAGRLQEPAIAAAQACSLPCPALPTQDAKADIIRRSHASTRAWQTYYRHLEKCDRGGGGGGPGGGACPGWRASKHSALKVAPPASPCAAPCRLPSHVHACLVHGSRVLSICRYAKSLDATKFSHPARDSSAKVARNGSGGKAGGSSSVWSGGKKRAGNRKIDELRQQNEARLAAKLGSAAGEQWAAAKRQMEGAAAKGWTAELAADAERVLASLLGKSPAAYLAAARWRLQMLAAEWEAQRLPSSAGVEGSRGARESAAAELWAAVADLLRRGLLQPGAGGGVPSTDRLAAIQQCTAALHALGLTVSAQHVADFAAHPDRGAGPQGRKKEGKSARKGRKAGEVGEEGGGSQAGSGTQAGRDGQTLGIGGARPAAGRGRSGAGPPPAGMGLGDARFQLRHCGHLLPHEAPRERDPRVESFNPDPWQRQVRQPEAGGGRAG